MISILEGEIISIHNNSIDILLQSGIGYEVFINDTIKSKLNTNETHRFHIYHHKTENSESLFGFLESEDKIIFKELIKISGVGGKVAMLILSLGRNTLIQACVTEDNKTIESIKGVGKKMAEKIILEFKDKKLDFITLPETKESQNTVNKNTELFSDIQATLMAMGYNPKDIEKNLLKLPEGMNDATEIIPYIIKQLH